jgi:hypothetical protein
MRRRALLVLVVLAAALVSAMAARAEIVTRQDAQGRTITFDVLTAPVDVDWYAAILGAAAHGDEISNVTIKIVAPSQIRAACGAGAAACFSRRGSVSTIVVPAGSSESLRATVLHEYGHHLDSAWAVAGVEELNGTPAWWATRGMHGLFSAGTVAFDYSLGWERSVGEIFAEDYAYIHTGTHYSIPWLAPPDETLKAALLAELGGAPTTPLPPAVTPPAAPAQPLTIVRQGTLAPSARRAVPFGLLGPGRRVTVTAAVQAPRRAQSAGRIDVTCNGVLVKSTPVVAGRTATLDAPGLGPGTCEAALVSTSGARQRFVLRVRLAIEPS